MAAGRGGVRGGDEEAERERARRAGGEGGIRQRAIEGKREGGRKERRERRGERDR